MSRVIKIALLDSVLTVSYITLVVLLLNLAKEFFPNSNPIIIPIFMLTLFVFSAALTGGLVFGIPVVWYLNSRKREAIRLWLWTISFIFVMLLIALALLLYLV